jgi:hypothetical protein
VEKAAQNAPLTALKTYPPWASVAPLSISPWRVMATCMAGALCSQCLVEPSMSANRKVMVPVGGC